MPFTPASKILNPNSGFTSAADVLAKKYENEKAATTPEKHSQGFNPAAIAVEATPMLNQGVKNVASVVASSEIKAGQDIAAPLQVNQGSKMLHQDTEDYFTKIQKPIIDQIHEKSAKGEDITKLQSALAELNKNAPKYENYISPDTQEVLDKKNSQVLGDFAGVALDATSFGTYGPAAKGARTGELLAKGAEATAPIVEKTTTQKLKDIGVKTAKRTAQGAGTGYAYDVSNNLQEGKDGGDIAAPGFGTVAGSVIPTFIGGIQAGVALTKESAPKFINSLIKPKQADFSYGKNPGRTVSEMGITGNSLNDFANNIHTAKQDIGTQLSNIYTSPANANIRLDVSSEIQKIDDAIAQASKGGKSNQSVVTSLQNTKDALLYEHGIDSEGNIVKVGNQPRDLSNLSPKEVFDLKRQVAENTRFTGNPSDDKSVNSTLKDIYGGLKESLNNSLGKNNPEIKDLNQKYADLTSAELATRNRNAIVQRANMISLPVKFGGATALITSLSTGGAALPTILAGATAAGLEKAMESTAVKTRIAAWLGKESPSVVARVLQNNPSIREVLYRALPKFASQLGQSDTQP